ncbi:LPXTG cell wall anchor domain-containing protein [Streptomyces kunmingensis]|uniref:LPXTG cell wall anchor domain-containing protein n=1 Tax=Streptomyces kunmingensis TaxID=68225 RepID=A0ABU6CET1_9ACTN|nr:LPXTG cell wall anchor domain-containing protein [Streptomyces kunmingensis]MEB3962375.1 LPXTG cell wall anchor domain-containing protein [Streptomyces kunmingensis]
MKLRRALVTAAATAAVAPLALLSAPAAFASVEAPGTSAVAGTDPSASQTASPGTGEPGTTETETPPAGGSSEEGGSTEDGANTPDPGSEGTTPDTETPPVTTPDPETPPSVPDPSETDETEQPGDEPGDEAGDDECVDYEDSPGTLAELRGLPSKIVAGSGWHGFTFRVSNKTDTAFESVTADLYTFAYAYDRDTTEITKYLHVQHKDKSGWHNVDTGIYAQDTLSFGEAGALAPGEHADLQLRIKVDPKAPTGIGGSVAFATSVNTDGLCGFNVPEDQEYRFEILAADAKPGKVTPATSAPRPSNTPAPQASSTPLAGSLAETGADSTLPTLGFAGGLAVVAGAGVVYSVRRRKVSNEA